MIILIDYDNIQHQDQQQGVLQICDAVVRKIDQNLLSQDRQFEIRLYGGWYEGFKFTRKAQHLAIQAQNDFPTVFLLHVNSSVIKHKVTVSLIYAMAALPRKHLFATYRKRSVLGSIQCNHPLTLNCSETPCPMLSVYEFMEKKKCPKDGCSKNFEDFLWKGEQKLVDSMLVCDLLHYSNIGETHIAVVTSDDDFWPSMLMAMDKGTIITHIDTRPRARKNNYYEVDKHMRYYHVKYQNY